MGKNFKLNEIPLKTEEDVLEFIDVIATKLPVVKQLIKKRQLENQSLLNRLQQAQTPVANNGYSDDDVQTSVLDRATGRKAEVNSDDAAREARIEQLRAAQAPEVVPEPGDIGQLDLGTVELPDTTPGITPPSQEDLTPIGTRVAGKAEGFKTVGKRLKKAANDLRKK